MSDSIRVLIADDHMIVREGLRLILETGEGFELVGEATDGAEAVRQEADHFATATGIPCTLDLATLPPLPDDIREHALRVVSEGLTNVARHAQASQVWIRLASGDDDLEVEVRDDGVGFDPAAAAAQSGHYGLLGVRERARLAGGTLVVESAPGKGTILRISVPLNRC